MKIDETITTVGDIKQALKDIPDDLQVYVLPYDQDVLIEITETMMVLPKRDEPTYCIFRTH